MDSDPSKLNFTWSCVSLTESEMDFHISFEHVEEVSKNEMQDEIQINFVGNQYFAASDGQTLAKDGLVLLKRLPLQLDPTVASKVG